MFTVYVVVNLQKEIYIGQTNNFSRRLEEHNDPNCRLTLHTKRRSGPWQLVHSENYPTRSEAIRREKQLKSSRGRAWIRSLM